jgi:hypothetical protein
VACLAFYIGRFGTPPHRFLRLLLQFYGLELHHLTPSEILHIAAFVTVDVSYVAPQAHGIINVALHREYSLVIVFIFS